MLISIQSLKEIRHVKILVMLKDIILSLTTMFARQTVMMVIRRPLIPTILVLSIVVI